VLKSLTKEQLIELIKTEFADVTRKGGVSWHEGWVIDSYGSDEECAAARLEDTDQNWMELVENPDWEPGAIWAPWSFLDPISIRYYFVAAMVRYLAGDKSAVEPENFVPNHRFFNIIYGPESKGEVLSIANSVEASLGFIDISDSFNFASRFIGNLNQRQLSAVARFVQYHAEEPTRLELMKVLNEADMNWDEYVASGETWTPDPIWSKWNIPLKYWSHLV
jgi:hypothetical protein